MQSKEKKIEQKEREVEELKAKLEEKEKMIGQFNVLERQKNSEKSQEAPKLSTLRKEKKFKKIDRPAFLTNLEHQSNTVTLFDKF